MTDQEKIDLVKDLCEEHGVKVVLEGVALHCRDAEGEVRHAATSPPDVDDADAWGAAAAAVETAIGDLPGFLQ